MRKSSVGYGLLVVGLISLFVIQSALPVLAQDRTQIGSKAERGVKNLLFGWTEIPKRMVDITKESNNPFWGIVAGAYQGTLKAFARTSSGIVDVATAPVQPDKGSFVEPDMNVE